MLKKFLRSISRRNTVWYVFLFFVFLLGILGILYYFGINPSNNSVEKIIMKYTVDNYSIPYSVAERYLIWLNMRSFFFILSYSLTLLGIFASLMTVFYASTDSEQTITDAEESKESDELFEKRNKKNTIIFLSLLSVCFTIANLFINPGTLANMSQHAWRQLDTCIMETVFNPELQNDEKNRIIIDKVSELEEYIETFEH